MSLGVIMLTCLVFGVLKISQSMDDFRNSRTVLADHTDVKIEIPFGMRLLNVVNRPVRTVIAQAINVVAYDFNNTNSTIQIPVMNRRAILPPKIIINQPYKREYLPILT